MQLLPLIQQQYTHPVFQDQDVSGAFDPNLSNVDSVMYTGPIVVPVVPIPVEEVSPDAPDETAEPVEAAAPVEPVAPAEPIEEPAEEATPVEPVVIAEPAAVESEPAAIEAAPVEPATNTGVLTNSAVTYMLTKDPVLAMMAQQGQVVPQDANSAISYVAANSKDPLLSLGLTNNPAVYLASKAKDPTLALAATNINNPAATYMLTKDPILTMLSQQGQKQAAPAKPTKVDPLNTLMVNQIKDVTPALAYTVTGDPNMIMHGQWTNKNLALANAMGTGSDPASKNPAMDLIAASTITDPNTSYALTGNPLIAHAVASGKGKDVAGLLAGQSGNPMMTYALTKDPTLAFLSSQQNPLLSYTALQHSPALAAIASQNPMMFLMKN